MDNEWWIFIIVGIFFIVLGIASIIWGRRESSTYFKAISERLDVREFVHHSPHRPEPAALKTGGWICIALGIIVSLVGGFWFFKG